MKKNTLLRIVSIYSAIAIIIFLFIRILLVNSYSADIGGVENNVIYSICKVLYGGSLYDNPETGNFNITQYSPMFYYFTITIGKIFRLDPLHDLHSLYIIGRSISLIFNIVGGFLIFKILNKLFKIRASIAIVAVSIYFLNLTRIHFAARPDSLFSLVFIVILYCFVQYFISEKKEKKYLYFATGILFCSLSIFVKQSGVQFLFIVPSFFLLTKQYKTFLVSSILLAISTVCFFSLFYLLYGTDFISNVFGGLKNGISLIRIYDVFSWFFLKKQLFFVLGIFFSFMFFSKSRTPLLRFLSFSIICLFSFAFLTSAKEGSWINYYNEFVIAVILLSTVGLNKIANKIDFQNSFIKTTVYLFSVYLIVLLPNIVAQKLFHEHYEHIKSPRSEFENKEKVARFLRDNLDNGSSFLAFDEHINSMLANNSVIPNKDLLPPITKFNFSKFNEALKKGKIQFVIFPVKNPIYNFMGNDFSQFIMKYNDNDFIILENTLR